MRLGHFARLFGLVGIAVTCFVRPQPVSAATIISTVPAWDGINSFGDFGKSGFSGWGQSFTVPADAHLDTFTFYLKSHDLQDTPVTYSMHLYPFHQLPGTPPFVVTGAELYASDVRTMAPGTTTYRAETFTPNVTLAPGGTYLALLYAENHATVGSTADSRLRLGYAGSSAYAGGLQRTTQPYNGDLVDLVASAGWGSAGGDLAFTANFSPVPEPATALLLAAAAACLSGRRPHRRRLPNAKPATETRDSHLFT